MTMSPKLKAKKVGPMDMFFKKKTGDQDGEERRPPSSRPFAKEEEPHETHSFEWCGCEKKPTTITCNKAGTIQDVLKRSSQFREIAEKNKDKELAIIRDGKVISSHFPCCVIKKELLTVKYIKAVDKAKQPASGSGLPQRKGPSGELVIFHVLTKGGRNVVRIMRNPALQINYQEITVYAYKGEKVKQALKRDGRLSVIIFEKNCALSHKSTEVNTEMSNLVDDLDGQTFRIILLNNSNPPESQPGSLDDAYEVQNESQDPPQQSTTTESVNDNKKQPEVKDDVPTVEGERKISLEMVHSHLSKKFEDMVKRMKAQPVSKYSRTQNLLRVEYGKNDQTCKEVRTVKRLMQLSDSVCQVRINGRPSGSGFLLFDKFVLTNGHVVYDFYNESKGQLENRVTVHFSYESLDQINGEQESGAAVVVKEIVDGEYYDGASAPMCDWALLKLDADQKLPDGLLTHFGFLPRSGGICIIGHPDGGVKKIDPCFIIPSDDRRQIVERRYHENPEGVLPKAGHYSESYEHIQLVTRNFFMNVAESVKGKQVLTYESCCYEGSSGSPVFDKDCNVIAMHTGGYPYHNVRGKAQSVIEYGHPLSIIIERIIIQMVEKRRLDVLKEYLACSYAQQKNMMISLKNLVKSRNLIAFKNAASVLVDADERLKMFFEFILKTEDPAPMDTESY